MRRMLSLWHHVHEVDALLIPRFRYMPMQHYLWLQVSHGFNHSAWSAHCSSELLSCDIVQDHLQWRRVFVLLDLTLILDLSLAPGSSFFWYTMLIGCIEGEASVNGTSRFLSILLFDKNRSPIMLSLLFNENWFHYKYTIFMRSTNSEITTGSKALPSS
jgi:hypothetical protein